MPRPKLPEEAKRVRLNTTISPVTRRLLLAAKLPEDQGLGDVIDRWARELNQGKQK